MKSNLFTNIGKKCRRYGGTALMIIGITLLAFIALPPASWLFAAGIALLIAGYTLRKRCRW